MTRLFIAFLPFCGDGHRISSRVPAPPVFIKAADQASDRSHRTANGALYGRPNGTPAATVCTGLRWTLPSRLLLRSSVITAKTRYENSPAGAGTRYPNAV